MVIFHSYVSLPEGRPWKIIGFRIHSHHSDGPFWLPLPKAGVNLETSSATLQSRSAAAVNQKNEKVQLIDDSFAGYTGYTTQYMEDDYNILQSTRGISIDQWIIWYDMDMNRFLNTAQVILFLGLARGLCIGLALHSLTISCDLLHLLGFGLLTCSWAWLPCSGQLSLQTLPCHVFGRAFQDMTWYEMTCHYVSCHDKSLHAIALHDLLNDIIWYYKTLHYTLHYMTFSTFFHYNTSDVFISWNKHMTWENSFSVRPTRWWIRSARDRED